MRHTMLSSLLLILAFAANAQETQDQQPPEDQQATQQNAYEQTTYDPAAQQDPQQAQQQATQQSEQPSSMQQTQASGGMQSQGQQGGGQANLARAQFTSDVQNKEPVDQIDTFRAQQDPIYFFTEVKNAEGQTITHRWLHNGEVMAEVPLEVGSDSWRTWSSKELLPDWEGEWTVEVVDAQGNVIDQQTVNIEAAEQTRNVSYSPEQQTTMQQQGQTTETGVQQQDEGDELRLDEGWDAEGVSGDDDSATEGDQDDEQF